MFLGVLSLDTTVTSLCSDEPNRYLLTSDSRGVVTVWDIQSYALFETLAEVATEVSKLSIFDHEMVHLSYLDNSRTLKGLVQIIN